MEILEKQSKTEEDTIVNFFKVMHKTIRKYGITKIIDSVREFDNDNVNNNYNEIKDFIIESVCKEKAVSKKDLLYSTKRGKVTTARLIAVVLLKKHLSMKDTDVSRLFNRSRQSIYILMKKFRTLDKKNPVHNQKYFITLEKVEEKLKSYIETLKALCIEVKNQKNNK